MNNEFNPDLSPFNNNDESNNTNDQPFQPQNKNNFVGQEETVENKNINTVDPFQQVSRLEEDNVDIPSLIENQNTMETVNNAQKPGIEEVITEEDPSINPPLSNNENQNTMETVNNAQKPGIEEVITEEDPSINPPLSNNENQNTMGTVNNAQKPGIEGVIMEEDPSINPPLPNNKNQNEGPNEEIKDNQLQTSKNKSSVVGNIITVIILLAFAAAIGYIYWLSKPKNIFINSINKVYSDLYTYVEQSKSDRMMELSKNNVINYNTNIKFAANTADASESDNLLNKININYILGKDQKNEKMSFKFNATYDKNDLIDIQLYNYSNLLYIYIDEALDKYIQIDNVDLSSINNEEMKSEISYLTEKLKDLFIDSLKDEYFSKEDEGIIINNQTVNTKKTNFIINDKRLKEILNFILNGLKNDDNSIKAIVTIGDSNISEKEVIDKLNELIKEYKKSDIILDGEISLDVYSKGLFNEVVKYNLITKYSDNSGKLKDMRLSYAKYTEDGQNKKEIFFREGIISKCKLIIKGDDDKSIYDLQLYDMNGEETTNIIFDIERKKTELVIDKEFNNKTNINILIKDVNNGDEEDIKLGFIIDTNVIVGGKLDEIDSSKVVNINNLTEEEQLMIITKYSIIFNLLSNEYNPFSGI